MVEVVGTSFDAIHWTKLVDTFLKLQKVVEAIILCNSDNIFEVPNIFKRK